MSVDLELRDQLREVARRRETTTYQPIANALGVDLDQDSERGRLGRILGDISRAEHAEGRPLLSAVVVLGSSNVPGNGFFDLARELGVHTGDDDLAFFAVELRRVHDYWARQPRGTSVSSPPPATSPGSTAPREGSLVSHPVHGEGVVEFWKDAFPAARVKFKGGTLKVNKDELALSGQQPPHPR